MITADHPFHFLLPLFRGQDSIFALSRYVYTPDSLMDERESVVLPGRELTEGCVEAVVATLRPDQEIAFHSIVRISGRNWHIPMIDFSLKKIVSVDVFARMSRYLPKALMLNMAVYTSGRSLHAYSATLLTPKEWPDFMGRLLLINPPNGNVIVDTRWVGHRLIGGFGSLRWSSNSKGYLALPARVPFR